LPPNTSSSGMKIRIPPELMPDDDTILHYFDIYFTNVHPYVPVLNKSLFYRQWHTNRNSISPLILEAIFAIAGRLADEPTEGHQWLALVSSQCERPRLRSPANKHRTHRLVHGHAKVEYTTSTFDTSQGTRVCTQERLFLPLLDDCGPVCTDGQRSGS